MIIEMIERFPHQQACIDLLEGIRYKEVAFCPYCASTHVARKAEHGRIGRWNCHDCYSSFNVLQGTLFQGTKVPLQKWFLAIVLITNAKKSLSSHQLARHLSLNQKTAWYMMTRIRAEMAKKDSIFLRGIVEADETYVGGKPRKGNKRKDDDPHDPDKTVSKKTPVLGLVERGGQVAAKVVQDVTTSQVLQFILTRVKTDESTLMTDENTVYNFAKRHMEHKSVSHKEQYVDGDVHTNTLEGFWSLLKRAWYGQHHKYKRKFMPLYVAEACWKYNNRKTKQPFDVFIRGCFA